MENKDVLFTKIYEVVKKIPKGKVATYGQIAQSVNSLSVSLRRKVTPRMVGVALHNNPDPKNIPCHRIVDYKGRLSKSFAFGGIRMQRKLLQNEGVLFSNYETVDMNKCKFDF